MSIVQTTPVARDYAWLRLGMALAIVLGVSWLSSLPVQENFVWYESLAKPALNPPSWVFGVIWPVLYVLMTVSAWHVWRLQEGRQDEVEEALALFVFQLVANFFWPLFFFGMQSTWLGLMWIGLVWMLVSLTCVFFASISRFSALLLLPYWLWVSFASYISYGLWSLNG